MRGDRRKSRRIVDRQIRPAGAAYPSFAHASMLLRFGAHAVPLVSAFWRDVNVWTGRRSLTLQVRETSPCRGDFSALSAFRVFRLWERTGGAPASAK